MWFFRPAAYKDCEQTSIGVKLRRRPRHDLRLFGSNGILAPKPQVEGKRSWQRRFNSLPGQVFFTQTAEAIARKTKFAQRQSKLAGSWMPSSISWMPRLCRPPRAETPVLVDSAGGLSD
jgi:hypothetical protein